MGYNSKCKQGNKREGYDGLISIFPLLKDINLLFCIVFDLHYICSVKMYWLL